MVLTCVCTHCLTYKVGIKILNKTLYLQGERKGTNAQRKMVEGSYLQSRISARISRELLIGILGEVITFQWLKLNPYLFGNRNRRLQMIYWEMLYVLSKFMWPFRAGTVASYSTKISSKYFVFYKSECFSSMAEGLQEALLTPEG